MSSIADVLEGRARWTVEEGDCLDVLPRLPDSSVSLICTDPPYYRVKDLPWDRQWDSPEGYLSWFGDLCREWQRVLKPNGSLYVFASPKMAARVECKVGEFFEVLNCIIWCKRDGTVNEGGCWSRADKDCLRRFFEQKENIIFAEHFGADNAAKGEAGYGAKCDELRGFVFEPLRAYLNTERNRAGLSVADIDTEWQVIRQSKGCMAGHWFGIAQWELPTLANYTWLRDLFNGGGNGSGPYLTRDHEDLRREYEDLRRPFNVTADVPYTDVWDFPTVQAYPGKHPCEKPLAMMEHIVRASSREGDVVLDCFAGSGVTGEACQRLGRRFVGIEKDEHWAAEARKRIGNATAQPALFLVEAADKRRQEQPALDLEAAGT